jgi:prevent-host-death family protein
MRAANVRSISDLKTRSAALVREVCEGGQPVVITQHGRAKAVLMDVREHDRLRETLAMLKLLAQSEASLAKGARTYTTAEVRASARAVLTRARRDG